MALYIYNCHACGHTVKRILKNAEEAKENEGKPCGVSGCCGILKRATYSPSVHTKEVLSFAHQLKDVERFVDAQKLYEERSHADPRKP